MADVPVRFAGLRGTLAAFAVDLFAGRIGSLTDAPMCSGGYDRWGIYDGAAWRLGVASDYAGNANVLSLRINGAEVIDSTQNVKANAVWTGGALRVNALGDVMGRNAALSGWLTVAGVTRLSWDSSYSMIQTSDAGAVGSINNPTDPASVTVTLNANLILASGSWNAIKASTSGVGYPSRLQIVNGGLTLRNSLTSPTADMQVMTDIADRWNVTRYGKTIQFTNEPVQSAQYTKTADTTIGPNATAKASLLNGGVAAGGFAAVSEPAGRWNAVGAQSDIRLKGKVSSVANQVLVFELYRNGVSVATLTLPARTYGTNTPWRLEIDQDVRVAGASGTVRVDMRAYVTADNASSQSSCYQMDSTLTGVGLTAAATWDVVCTIPNNAANSITCIKGRKVG